MAGSGAALVRANYALAKSQALSGALGATAAGADGASHVASSDTVGGTLWTTMAGFITALQTGQTPHSLPTRAQMAANPVPAAVSTITTSGYATAGDGGGATYVRATGPFSDGGSFQSADGAWWKLSMPVVSVAMFGAVGGTGYSVSGYAALPDDTAAIQKAITFAQANCNGALVIGPREYRFTKSLNCGKTNAFTGFTLQLMGSCRSSRLVADLTESYPAFDFTNGNRGFIQALLIESTTTSQHTCMLMFAETTNSGMNLFTMRDVIVNDYGSSSLMAVFGYSADQFNFDNCAIYGGGAANLFGAYFGLINPGSIASKFYTSLASTGADATLFMASNTQFMCGTGPALFVDGFNQITGTGNYTNVLTVFNQPGVGHTQGMLRLRSTPPGFGQRFSTVTWLGCRFEDQAANHLPGSPTVVVTGSIAPNADGQTSTLTVTGTTTGALAVGNVLSGTGIITATTVLANVSANVWTVTNSQTVASTTISSYLLSSPCVHVVDYIYESTFGGWYNTGGAGVFGGPGMHVNSTVKVGLNGNGSCFNNAGALVGGDYHFVGGGNNVGLFDQTNSRQYRMGGRIGSSFAAIQAAIGATVEEITDTNTIENGRPYTNWLRSEKRVLMPYTNAPTNYRLALKGEANSLNYYASYTGGTGTATIGNFTTYLPGALRTDDGENFLTTPVYEMEIIGSFASGMVSGTTLTIGIQQALSGGTKFATLATLSSIPAYGAATWWRMVVRFQPTGGSGLTTWSTIEAMGSGVLSAMGQASLYAGGFDITQNVPFVINIIVNSPTSNPLGTNFFYRIR